MIFERVSVLDKNFDEPAARQSTCDRHTHDTTPIAGTIYVDRSGASFTPCAGVSSTTAAVYGNTSLRTVYRAIVDNTSYSLPAISDSEVELIAPVVDCTIPSIVNDNPTLGRFHHLARQRSNPENVSAMVVMLSNQHYVNEAQDDYGTVGFALKNFIQNTTPLNFSRELFQIMFFVSDTRTFRLLFAPAITDVDTEGLVSMESVLLKNATEMPKILKTTRRVGYFQKSFSEQSNANNFASPAVTTVLNAFSLMMWLNNPVLHDWWAWVQSRLALPRDVPELPQGQVVVVDRDAFVSVSTTQIVSTATVLASWAMNGAWTLRKFCMHDAILYASHENAGAVFLHVRRGRPSDTRANRSTRGNSDVSVGFKARILA